MADKEAKRAQDVEAVIKSIAAMDEPDKTMGEKLHKIITTTAPNLMPRTWYGMPAYSNGDKIICFFRGRQKFGERFMTLGFNDSAKLDDGSMWPIYFAITDLSKAEEDKITDLVAKAVS